MPEGLLEQTTGNGDGAVAVLALLVLWAFVKEVLPMIRGRVAGGKPKDPCCSVDGTFKRAVFDTERGLSAMQGDMKDLKDNVAALQGQMSVVLDRSGRGHDDH